MIDITDKTKCCGCSACIQACPTQSITMQEDEEGFLYPKVDTISCIECGLCNKVCPVLNRNEDKAPIKVYAAINNNENQRLHSSSGGIFVLLAEYVLKLGGVVFGARFNEEWGVEHCYTEKLNELQPLLRSKYVQSNINGSYKIAEDFLKNGRQVLFAGTPCQIAGLKKYLRKEYENLLTVDMVCHGVPSPGIWRKYLDELKTERSEVSGKNTVLSSSLKSVPVITGINFREKNVNGYSWKKFGFVVYGKSPYQGDKNSVLLSDMFRHNPFMKAFLNDLTLRPSCYDCLGKNGRSDSDFTLADFWGISSKLPELDDNKGCSVIFIQNERANDIIQQLNILATEISCEEGVMGNPAYIQSACASDKRDLFWEIFYNTNSFIKSVNIVTHKNLAQRIFVMLKKVLVKIKWL